MQLVTLKRSKNPKSLFTTIYKPGDEFKKRTKEGESIITIYNIITQATANAFVIADFKLDLKCYPCFRFSSFKFKEELLLFFFSFFL